MKDARYSWTPSSRELAAGLTREAIEQMALANNPAFQQALAAATRVGGTESQVGLKSNAVIGFYGAQVSDAGTDRYSLFVEQTLVSGDKLA